MYHRDWYHAVTQTYNFGAETHLGGGDTGTFCLPLAAIARSLPHLLPVQLFRKAHKDSDGMSFADVYVPKLTVLAKLLFFGMS